MGQPPLDTSRPDLSRPTGQELQPAEPALVMTTALERELTAQFLDRTDFARSRRIATPEDNQPCSPPASQPAAEPAEPSAPSREGSGSAGGAAPRPESIARPVPPSAKRLPDCCEEMKYLRRSASDCIRLGIIWGPKFLESWRGCPWCLAKFREGE